MCYVLLSFLSFGGTSHAWSWGPQNSTVTTMAFYALICTRAAKQLARPGTRRGLSKMLPSCPKCPRLPSFLENGANILSIASMGVAISPPPNCPMVPCPSMTKTLSRLTSPSRDRTHAQSLMELRRSTASSAAPLDYD